MLLVETDKDLRNSADFLVIERIADAEHALHSGEPAGSAGGDERQPVRDG
jgi:hypothetical protein